MKNIYHDTSSCMKPCSGLVVTSFFKTDEKKDLGSLYSMIVEQYNDFKKITAHPPGLMGRYHQYDYWLLLSEYDVYFRI